MSIFGLYTSNPALTAYFWKSYKSKTKTKMSLGGILFKSFCMLCLVAITACYTWKTFFDGNTIKWHITIGMFIAIIASLFISFKHNLAKYLLPIYALAKGFFLGGISAYTHKSFHGLPIQAIAITIITFFVMLFLFQTRLIKVTKQFKAVIISATVSIFTMYFIAWLLALLEIPFPFIWGNSWFAIVFTVLASLVAAFSLLLDFEYIKRQIGRAPKEKEWVATWGFLISLIWLYVEILRLLKKLAIRL